MKPTYFDLTVADMDAACRFFAAVLGWRFKKLPMPLRVLPDHRRAAE
jgi:predicted enzyme related to lactoylglutathione lyase